MQKLLLLCVLLVFPGQAWAETWTVGAGSAVTYYVHHPMHEVVGVSQDVKGEITFSAAAISDFTGVTGKPIQVDWTSFDSDNGNRDQNVLKFVEARQYPTITFVPIAIRMEAEESPLVYQAKLAGHLYVKGTKKKMVSDATIDLSDPNRLRIRTRMERKLTDFGIDPPSLLFVKTKDPFEIDIDLFFVKK